MSEKGIEVGDWIRFMHSGRLLIDVVDYIVPRSAYNSTREAMTAANGQVSFSDVLEVRRPALIVALVILPVWVSALGGRR